MKSHRHSPSSPRSADSHGHRHDGHTLRHEREDGTEETKIRRRPTAPVEGVYEAHRHRRIAHEYVGWSLYPSDDPRAFDGEHAPYAAWGSHDAASSSQDDEVPAWGESVASLDARRRARGR